ncbi:MAG TPA: ABC transporter permease, partial [Candidatus Krumholzibacterium sp.]|nr:ABC transporter permease [Candidatus Krumholzibacterium sp.]
MNGTDKANTTPPALASFILRLAARGDGEYSLIREMTEEYGDYAARKGGSAARRWFWRQTLRSLPSIAAGSAASQASMVKNYFKIALRNMRRRKGYSLINIIGLALGMTCFIAIMMYVDFERSYDSFNEKSDRIYRIWMYWEGWSLRGLHNFAPTNGAMVPALRREYPEVEAAVRTQPTSTALEFDGRSFVERGMYAGEDFFDIFTFPLVKGDPATALVDPFTMVISRKLAQKLFGPEDPIGKVVTASGGRDYTVTGIFGEVPANSHFNFDFLTSFTSMHSIRRDDIDNEWGILNYINYVLLREGVSKDEFEAKLTGLVDRNLPDEDAVRTYHLQPLRDIHLRTDIFDYTGRKSDTRYLYLLTAIAFVILSIACVNYINMATSQASLRAKEVGIRKTSGAGRPELVRQFLGESFLLSLIALAVSLLAVQQLHPFLGRLFDLDIPLRTVFNLRSIAVLLGIMTAAGLLSGAYPAFLLASMRPASVMKSDIGSTGPER